MPKLKSKQVENLTKPGTYEDGEGLRLVVKATGRKVWVFRYQRNGKRHEMGLGRYPDISLVMARAAAKRQRCLLQDGVDPLAERQAARLELIRARARQITFKEVAYQCHKVKSQEFRNAKHSRQWISTLENYAFPTLGDLPVADIQPDEVLSVLEPIWTVKPETASRLRQRIENVFDHAIASNQRNSANPARLKGCLQPLLPKTEKVKKKNGTKHHPALPIADMPRFMAQLRRQEGIAAKALEFLILTASRPSEVIGSKVDQKPAAVWSEVVLEDSLWIIPEERMKAGLVHRIPLSAIAKQLLENMPRMGELIFPGQKGAPLSNATLGAVIRRMHKKDLKNGGAGFIDPKQGRIVTPHGFRSTFKDWSLQGGRFPDHWSELALAHVNDDKTRAAYARGELVEERRGMMEEWAHYITQTPAKGENVVAVNFGQLRPGR